MRKELFDKLGSLTQAMRAITEKARGESRDLTAEEDQEWRRIEAEITSTETAVEREQREAQIAVRLEQLGNESAGKPAPSSPADAQRDSYSKAFRSYVVGGHISPELRALQADSDSAGGYVAPQAFYAKVIAAMDNMLPILADCTQIPLGAGASLGAPTLATDIADADWTAEIAAVSADSTMTFGKRELRPHPLTKYVLISQKLLRSAAIDIEGYVAKRLAYKMGVPIENKILNGTGTNEPLGVYVASANGISTGRDTTAASTTVFTADELFDVVGSVREPYLAGAKWYVHRDFVTRARKLKNGAGEYLWQPAMAAANPATIAGYPVVRTEYAPKTFTAGLYVGLFGNMTEGYWWVRGAEMAVQRLIELFALTNQVGFKSYLEADGAPVDENAFGRLILHT